MSIRDATEAVLRGWDAHERAQGRKGVIDFECYPDGPVTEINSRIQVLEQLTDLLHQAEEANEVWLTGRIRADLAYVNALLGQRLPLTEYLAETQGSPSAGWPHNYIERRRLEAVEALERFGVSWGPATITELEECEGRLTAEETADEIQAEAGRFEATVRQLVDTDAQFTLRVEDVNVDDYWAYWMDGIGDTARLRINLRHAQFTKIRARQLALHEIHGHALQGASYYQRALTNDVPWVRLLSVHAPQQILLEGLAQAFPYFVAQEDDALMTRTKLTLYTQLIRAQVHLMINGDHTISDCIAFLRSATPFTNDDAIADILNDRAVNPLLRSYLWSYGTGMDWFVNLAETAPDTGVQILRASYQDPLQPADLMRLWPASPPVGGQGEGEPVGHTAQS